MQHDDGARNSTTGVRGRFEGQGALHCADRVIEPVHAELVGGRERHSVGGQVAEGPRWWRGWVRWTGDDGPPATFTEVVLDLDNGRSGVVVIEPHPTSPTRTTSVHGVGPPPFDVP